jgi:hypothetical protein
MSRLRGVARVASLAAVLAVILLSGCTQEDAKPSPVPSRNIKLFSTDKLSASTNRVKGVAMSEFGAEISLNRHKVSIPPDALEDRTVISIEEPDPRFVVADFGPEGLKFEKPIEVSMHYGGLDLGEVEETDLTIYYFDRESGEWVDMHGMVDTVEETVMIRTDHFSRYALSDHHRFQHVAK